MVSFSRHHEREYGFCLESPVELVNLRVTGVVRVRKPTPKAPAPAASNGHAREGERMVYWGNKRRVPTAIYHREQLLPRAQMRGPAIIEEPTTTIIVPPTFSATVDDLSNLILERT